MKVYVKLYATLARSVSGPILAQHPQGLRAGSRLEVELPEGSTLADLMSHLALPRDLQLGLGLRRRVRVQVLRARQVEPGQLAHQALRAALHLGRRLPAHGRLVRELQRGVLLSRGRLVPLARAGFQVLPLRPRLRALGELRVAPADA